MFTQKFSMFLLLTIVISLVSCATYQPPKNYLFDKTKTINKPFDEVWGKIIQWFGNNNTPIKTIEKASGIISTEYSLNAAKIKLAMDCGVMGFGQWFNENGYKGNFNIIVEKIADNSTKVTINTFFSTEWHYTDSKVENKIDCNSTGYLENEIFEYISK